MTGEYKNLKIKKKLNSLISIFAVFFIGLSASAQEKFPPLRPHKTDTPPVIDGTLDDPVWQKAPHETGFKTWHPDYGLDMTENSIV
jgi:hypothetical protein